MHYLLKFGYDGRKFTGYQRGNGLNSVEDSILKICGDFGVSNGFSSAARTDRGVSAAGNVIFLKSGMEVKNIIGILNSQVRDIIFHSYAVVGSDFRVRFSRMKHYRYFLPAKNLNTEKFAGILGSFTGTHDFSMFSKVDSRSSIRTVEKVEVNEKSGFVEADIFGPNFVWNQIRSMVGFALYYTAREESAPDPFGVNSKRWPLVKPEPLVLMDIDYKDVEFTPCVGAKTLKIWKDSTMDLQLHSRVLSGILENAHQHISDYVPD